MRVAIEATSLGDGFTDSTARRGIYRVIERLIIELVNDISIDLLIVADIPKSGVIDIAKLNSIMFDLLDRDIFSQDIYQVPNLTKRFSAFFTDSEKFLLDTIEYVPNIALRKIIRLIIRSFELSVNEILSASISSRFLERVDVFHATSPFKNLPDRSIYTNNLVLTIYDMIPLLYRQFISERGFASFNKTIQKLRSDDIIICISHKTKEDICNYLDINPDNVFVTYLAADESFYQVASSVILNNVRSKYKIGEKPYLLSVCTIEPRKNILSLLKAFNGFIKSNPAVDLNLVLVGSFGSKVYKLFYEVLDSNLRSRVIFTGYVPEADLAAVYSGALAFVYPSLYEGFGLPPLEAMQCGTPVITSNLSSLPEVVGDAGIMINPHDEDALCQAIYEVVNNSNLRNNLSKKGLERSGQFSWRKCAEDTARVYKIACEYGRV